MPTPALGVDSNCIPGAFPTQSLESIPSWLALQEYIWNTPFSVKTNENLEKQCFFYRNPHSSIVFQCIPGVFQMYSKWIPNVFRYSKRIPSVFRMYSCIPSVLQVYSKCIPNVFHMYSCIPSVFQVYSKGIPVFHVYLGEYSWIPTVFHLHLAYSQILVRFHSSVPRDPWPWCHGFPASFP